MIAARVVDRDENGPALDQKWRTARSIFVSGNPFQWSARAVDSGDPQDWFTFTVGANLGSIKRRGGTVELSGLSANADVEIYDQRGQRIAVPTRSGTQREFFGFTFDVGKRSYLRVISRGGGTNFQLRIALRQSRFPHSYLWAPSTRAGPLFVGAESRTRGETRTVSVLVSRRSRVRIVLTCPPGHSKSGLKGNTGWASERSRGARKNWRKHG